jgi:hypothetical protein
VPWMSAAHIVIDLTYETDSDTASDSDRESESNDSDVIVLEYLPESVPARSSGPARASGPTRASAHAPSHILAPTGVRVSNGIVVVLSRLLRGRESLLFAYMGAQCILKQPKIQYLVKQSLTCRN